LVSALGDAREPLELRLWQSKRLADIADRAAGPVRREACDEGRVLVTVALDHGDDQLLADVTWEVEVDVRDRDELPVQEAAEREPRGDRVDMGEPGQVADDRADRAPPASPGWKEMARRAGPAHLERHLARELEHLPVEEEEAREPQLGDQRELFSQTG
jgi:hypothetical protein